MPALLFSISEPGPDVPETEFHDWYDNDHIPERIASPVFQSWTRYVAVDGDKPTYANIYDLESYEATKTPAYTQLVQKRSAHEQDILKRIAHIEPRVYDEFPSDPIIQPSALFDPKNPAPYVLFLSLDINEEYHKELVQWTKEEWTPHLSGLPGWVRTRNFRLKDWRRLGVEGSKDQTAPPSYLTIVDFASPEVAENPSLHRAAQVHEALEEVRTAISCTFGGWCFCERGGLLTKSFGNDLVS